MKKVNVINNLREYLKRHNIYHETCFNNGTFLLTMLFRNCPLSPNEIIESCIWFYDEVMEVRTYYSETASNWIRSNKNMDENLLGLLNYINATVWMNCSDGVNGNLYKSSMLYCPRIYRTEDALQDITMTTIIPYDFFFFAEVETKDYITALCPEILDKLSPAIFGLVLGEINLKQSKYYVERLQSGVI